MQRHTSHVRDWMTPEPLTVQADTSLIEAYTLMQRHAVRRLPVVDQHQTLIGIITRSDIQQVLPFVAEERERMDALFALAGMSVEEIMRRDPITVAPYQAIQDAAQRMIAAHISGLPVVEAGRVVGIITESDIFRLVVAAWSADSTAPLEQARA